MQDIPQIHLINLDRSADRLEEFREFNPHLSNFVRVAAIDGASLDREALVRSGQISADLPYGPGALGCALSHMKLWEQAVDEDRSLTIFEDDIVVSHYFERQVVQILNILPSDWDFIQWGYLLNPLFIWVNLGVSKVRLQGYGPREYLGIEGLKEFQLQEFPPAPLRLLHSFGLQGYSISPKGARAALNYCLPLRKRMIQFPQAGVTTEDEGIDCALCGLYPSTKAFICAPQLLIDRQGQESIRKRIDVENTKQSALSRNVI